MIMSTYTFRVIEIDGDEEKVLMSTNDRQVAFGRLVDLKEECKRAYTTRNKYKIENLPERYTIIRVSTSSVTGKETSRIIAQAPTAYDNLFETDKFKS